MNKYLKLTLIFAAIIGVFVALRFVDDVETDPVNPNSVSKYSKLYDEIRSEWRERKQWDETLYKTHMDTINKYYTYDYIEKKEYNLLFELVNANAVVTIGEFFDSEMKNAECDDSKIEKNKAGLDFISEYKNSRNKGYDFSKDTRVANADTMYKQYKKIIEFCDKDFNVTAKLNGECEWVPFSYYNDKWNDQKDLFEKGKYYTSHFYNINKVKDAWSSYDSIVQQSKTKYYNDLAEKIKLYFDKRYNNEKLKNKHDSVIGDYNKLNETNEGLRSRYNEVIEGYNSIINSYSTGVINNRINNYDKEINKCRYGTDKYNRKVEDKNKYIKNVRDARERIKKVEGNIKSLRKDFDKHTSDMNNLIDTIENYQKNYLDEYINDLKAINKSYKEQSLFDILDQYYEDMDGRIIKMSNNLPMVKKNINESYISYLEEYSGELNGIIEYIENLKYEN